MAEASASAVKDDGQAGDGAPAGGSPEGGSESELDERFEKRIKAALANQRAHYETQLGSVRAEFEAFKEGVGGRAPPAAPKAYTKAELKAAVEAGQVTQEQADDIWDRQREAQITERAESAALDVVARTATKERIDADIAAYRQLKPEIMESGSDLREKITAEFKYLVSVGHPGRGPEAVPTQLAAIRAVLGPLDKLERAAAATRAQESEEQVGSGGAARPAGGGTSKKLVDHLQGDAKDWYERGIRQGRYKDWDAVEAELKFASPKTRARLGLPA